MPMLGAGFSIWLFISLSGSALLVGSIWLLIGIVYLVFMLKQNRAIILDWNK